MFFSFCYFLFYHEFHLSYTVCILFIKAILETGLNLGGKVVKKFNIVKNSRDWCWFGRVQIKRCDDFDK